MDNNMRKGVLLDNEFAKALAAEGELVDFEFRKTHVCKCKQKVTYSDGKTYCEAMKINRQKKLRERIEEQIKYGMTDFNIDNFE